MAEERNKNGECYDCRNKRSVPGNCHIECVRPDPEMTGVKYGIDNGWFYYPALFDPTWKEKLCSNYEPVSEAVSDAVPDNKKSE
jgi:hypothetical protein